MKASVSAIRIRSLLGGAVAIVLGCGSTVDQLGYNRGGGSSTGATGTGGATPSIGAMPCPTSYISGYRDFGRSQAAIDEKLDAAFSQLFHGAKDTEAIYFHVDNGEEQAVIRDVLHDNQARSEGMGLGMVIAAMLEERDEFDRLWRYAKTHLQYQSGSLKGYFRSYCDNSPTEATTDPDAKFHDCADPYGLQQFVMALLLAQKRWLPTANVSDYGDEAARLFDTMRNKVQDNGTTIPSGHGGAGGTANGGAAGTSASALSSAGASSLPSNIAGSSSIGGTASIGGSSNMGGAASTSATSSGTSATATSSGGGSSSTGKSTSALTDGVTNTFDSATKLVYDDPASMGRTTTGTALLMPGYYSVWAQVTGDPFYAQAAEQSRLFLKRVAHPKTGFLPVRVHFDGTPVEGWGDFAPEAYRALLNLAIDRIWGTAEPWQNQQIQAMLDFLLSQGTSYGSAYSLDGKSVLIADHQPEIILVAAVAAAISNHPNKKDFINAAWDVQVPTGVSRYYAGMLYLMSNLILGGRFRLCP